jgi:hypothetical protein
MGGVRGSTAAEAISGRLMRAMREALEDALAAERDDSMWLQ